MSLSSALRFVELARTDAHERERCYASGSRTELLDLLGFTEEEFEDAIRMRLVQCQTHEDALSMQELRFWFALL